MKKRKLVILGASGLLGTAVLREAIRGNSFERIIPVSRTHGIDLGNRRGFDEFMENCQLDHSATLINCIGWIPQKSSGNELADYERAQWLNSDLPALVSNWSEMAGFEWIQPLTDCVFSGQEILRLDETAPKTSSDVYGASKISGESRSASAIGLRSSFIGIESEVELMGWFLSQKYQSEVNGYVNHLWNGITNLAFAKIMLALAATGGNRNGVRHIVPADHVSKFELLAIIARYFNRGDIILREWMDVRLVDRRLSTSKPDGNLEIWNMAGYRNVPTIDELVWELAQMREGI